ncbi:putative F-box domain-containing protein [Septoria linicola]|nr:putative F-box domain-containing protein [Septoria linicola]
MAMLKLPTELIALIFSSLDDVDVFAARLSNKSLEEASFAFFGKRFFRKKGFMITSASLDVLKQIAQHQGLRKHVQHVWFNPDCYTFARPACAPDDEDSDMDSADDLITPAEKKSSEAIKVFNKLATQYEAYQQVMQDHASLLCTPKLEGDLAVAFESLPNLKTVGMRRSEDYGPYGWTVLRDAIGEDPRVLGPIPSGPVYDLSDSTYLFIAIISAAAKTGTQLQRLYTDAIEIDNIKEEWLSQSTLDQACNSILYIELNAVKGWLNTRPHIRSQPYNTLRRPEDFGAGLMRLLKATTNLKEIGLQIFPDRKQSHLLAPTARNPDSWRLSYPYVVLQKLSTTLTLPHLTRIKLEKVTSTSSSLIAFLKPSSAHLTSLKIRDVRLLTSTQTSPTNPSIFASTEDSSDLEPQPWQTFFTFLLTSCPELHYILLHHLMHDRGTVSFTEEAPPPMPAEEAEMLMNWIPPSHGGQGSFTRYEHVNLQVKGRENVERELARVVKEHWYHPPLFSYLMDEAVWHTDTSDEQW